MSKTDNYQVQFKGTSFLAFIPMMIFLIFCVMYFVIFKVFDMNVLAVGGFIGLLVGALFSKTYEEYWNAVIKGIGSPTSISIVVILLIIGMFTKLMAVSGVSNGFVWLAYHIGITGGVFTGFTFLASCLITSATGSSIGTLSTVFPILFPAGVLMGGNPGILAGAILSGAIFGDNLAPISDVTIASTTNQKFRYKKGNADIGGTVKYRLKYAIIAGVIALVLFVIFGGGGTARLIGADKILRSNMDPKGLIMLIPVACLLFVSIKTQSIFKAVTTGLITGIMIGLVSHTFGLSAILGFNNGKATGFLYDGFTGMIGTCLFCIALFGTMGVLSDSGVLDRTIQGICGSPFARTEKGAELLIAFGSFIATILVGGVTSASVLTFGPIADELGAKHDIHPYRRANILSGFANTFPAILPFISAFIFISTSVLQPLIKENNYLPNITPVQIFSGAFYPMILFCVLLFSILSGWDRVYEGRDGEILRERSVV
jgi:Na+/H+ antiporter NhaC